ncbi:MAG: hypothetical protein IKO55_07690, partial [Kiritimatiellae bacterium]|nr:hypothetical protein [Kiritimatiellia bacterium]
IGFYQQQAEDEWQRRTRSVLAFLEQTDPEKLQSLNQLQESDSGAFRNEIDAIYCSPACKEWRDKKRKDAERADADREVEQLALDLGEE